MSIKHLFFTDHSESEALRHKCLIVRTLKQISQIRICISRNRHASVQNPSQLNFKIYKQLVYCAIIFTFFKASDK